MKAVKESLGSLVSLESLDSLGVWELVWKLVRQFMLDVGTEFVVG